MYGTDYEYAASRLDGTVVRLGEEPVIIGNVNEDGVVLAKLSDPANIFNCKLEELNLKPVPLGMCNYKGTVTYLTRMPMRRDWKQGLRRGNFVSLRGFPAELIPPEILGATIQGTYPTFAEALAKVRKNPIATEAVAWCREWAVTRHGNVLYKGEEAAVGKLVGDVPQLKEEWMYLREALEESL